MAVKKHPFAFGIVTSKRTFYAKAASQHEMEDWVKAINDAKKLLATEDQPETFQPGTYTSQASFSGYSTSPSVGPGSYLNQAMSPGTGGALPPLSASFARIQVSTPTRRDPSASSMSSQGDYFASAQTPQAAVTSSDEDEGDAGEMSDNFPSATAQARILPIQTDPTKVILSAYLMKRGKGRRNWRKRWFVLTSGALVYTKSHMVSGGAWD